MWLLNLNFKGSRLAFWKESKKDLVWNSGNPESDSSSQLAVIFTKELEVSYKRKVQTYRKLWKPDKGARSWAWSTIYHIFSSFFTCIPQRSDEGLRDHVLQNFFFFRSWRRKLLGRFFVVFIGAFWVCLLFWFLFVWEFSYLFIYLFTLHPKNWKDWEEKRERGKNLVDNF